MKAKLVVKVTLNPEDPFDSEVIPFLRSEKNKAGFVRKALFCYVRGYFALAKPPLQDQTAVTKRKNRELDDKLARLTTLR